MLYTATYGYILCHQPPISLQVQASDGSGPYRRLTVQFMAVPVYGMVQSPKATSRSHANHKNTPFDHGSDKKDMVANSFCKDLWLAIKAIQK